MVLDARLNAYRPDLADERLRNEVRAQAYTAGKPASAIAPLVALRKQPHPEAPCETQILYGEEVTVFDEHDGWSWVQISRDRYVGYVETAALGRHVAQAAHQVIVPASLIWHLPDLKTPPVGRFYMTSTLSVSRIEGDYARLIDGRYMIARHLAALSMPLRDPASIAMMYEYTPYLWGGKTYAGLDCSGLVQIAWHACGLDCPRDSDMIETSIGEPIEPSSLRPLRRNDLVFWKGHVGMMLDESRLIHANGHHMLVKVEPLHEAVERIARLYGPVTGYRRPAL